MPTYQTALFQITALTNLHVGSGSQNYGIIDNLVQRDPLTGYPFMFASSLKGALRQYCAEQWGAKNADLLQIFGRETKDGADDQSSQPGKIKFLDARLLSIPVRTDQVPYVNLSSPRLIADFLETARSFHREPKHADKLHLFQKQLGHKIAVHTTDCGDTMLENSDIKSTKEGFDITNIIPILGEYPALITNHCTDNQKEANKLDKSYPTDLFKLLTDDIHLPVVARNKVGTDDDNNLWYEQILPRQTRFYFVVLYPATMTQQFKLLTHALTADYVHIGANASVGYGFCQLSLIETQLYTKPQPVAKP